MVAGPCQQHVKEVAVWTREVVAADDIEAAKGPETTLILKAVVPNLAITTGACGAAGQDVCAATTDTGAAAAVIVAPGVQVGVLAADAAAVVTRYRVNLVGQCIGLTA